MQDVQFTESRVFCSMRQGEKIVCANKHGFQVHLQLVSNKEIVSSVIATPFVSSDDVPMGAKRSSFVTKLRKSLFDLCLATTGDAYTFKTDAWKIGAIIFAA